MEPKVNIEEELRLIKLTLEILIDRQERIIVKIGGLANG